MTWVRFDDEFPIHRKTAPLDDATYRLHSEAIFWCSRNLTDGHIARDELAAISVRAKASRVARLVARGLWHVDPHECASEKCPSSNGGGWVIHDYLQYQPTREKVRAEQAAKAERQRKWMEKRLAGRGASKDGSKDASQDGSTDTSENASRDGPQDTPLTHAPSPTPPRREAGEWDSPEAPHAALGGGVAAGVERTKPKPAADRCHLCGNRLDTAYHRNVCLRLGAA